MASKARDCRLDPAPISIRPDVLHAPEESWKGLYKFVPRFCRPIRTTGKKDEKLQASVIDRYKRDTSYRPQNLGDFFHRRTASQPLWNILSLMTHPTLDAVCEILLLTYCQLR
jgi:hypothetical protein